MQRSEFIWNRQLFFVWNTSDENQLKENTGKNVETAYHRSKVIKLRKIKKKNIVSDQKYSNSTFFIGKVNKNSSNCSFSTQFN